jgi:hypothetical protein
MAYISYYVYAVCLLAVCAARWLTLPVRSRLAVAARGREGAQRVEKRLRMRIKSLRELLQKERKDREIYEAVSFLRNVTAVGMSDSMSADLALMRLAENKGVLQPAYVKTLGLLRLNKREEAAKRFGEAVGDGLGLDFIRVVLQWDDIDPRELTASLVSYQKSLKEMRVTARKKRDELLSDLIYIPVVINILLIFMNFIFIAYFAEQRDMLRDLFF